MCSSGNKYWCSVNVVLSGKHVVILKFSDDENTESPCFVLSVFASNLGTTLENKLITLD